MSGVGNSLEGKTIGPLIQLNCAKYSVSIDFGPISIPRRPFQSLTSKSAILTALGT